MHSEVDSAERALAEHLPNSIEVSARLHWLVKFAEGDLDLFDQLVPVTGSWRHVVDRVRRQV